MRLVVLQSVWSGYIARDDDDNDEDDDDYEDNYDEALKYAESLYRSLQRQTSSESRHFETLWSSLSPSLGSYPPFYLPLSFFFFSLSRYFPTASRLLFLSLLSTFLRCSLSLDGPSAPVRSSVCLFVSLRLKPCTHIAACTCGVCTGL